MGRRDRCQGKHTPLSPEKNIQRTKWLQKVPLNKDIIVISPAGLDTMNSVLSTRGFTGHVQVCDTDPIAFGHAEDYRKDNTYPDLRLRRTGRSILSTIIDYTNNGLVKQLSTIDLDMEDTIETVCQDLEPVLEHLIEHKYNCNVLVTFRNGHGTPGWNIDDRIDYLKRSLPKGVEYVSHETYYSGYTDTKLSRIQGSSMCISTLTCDGRNLEKKESIFSIPSKTPRYNWQPPVSDKRIYYHTLISGMKSFNFLSK